MIFTIWIAVVVCMVALISFASGYFRWDEEAIPPLLFCAVFWPGVVALTAIIVPFWLCHKLGRRIAPNQPPGEVKK